MNPLYLIILSVTGFAVSFYIFYSKKSDPNFENYFIQPKIIFKKHWEPAFNITGYELLDCEQGENLYLIGDHNVIGLEDSYITGIFAANKILIV
mgnify:CR=1 FL=1